MDKPKGTLKKAEVKGESTGDSAPTLVKWEKREDKNPSKWKELFGPRMEIVFNLDMELEKLGGERQMNRQQVVGKWKTVDSFLIYVFLILAEILCQKAAT